MIITILGATGSMGKSVVKELINESYVTRIRILGYHKKETERLLKTNRDYLDKIEVCYGSIADPKAVREVIKGAGYVINMAAVIPPLSDKNPKSAIEVNEIGVKVLVSVIEEIKYMQPKLIHTSTMGIYGDRNYKHPWGRVGDPLLLSPFDLYALTKMRGEFTVLESNIKNWVVLRQSAMLYDELMSKNISDGLMFHTCFNSPLEWVSAHDSAILIRNILRQDQAHRLNKENFWKHCFNISGGLENRVTGFETLDLGYKIIGASAYDFFEPNYNSLRNFHGMWFSDGDELQNLFHYHSDSIRGFWAHVLATHGYYKLAKLMPKKLLKAFIIKPLLKDDNAPYYWYNHNDEARMLAYFKGKEVFESISPRWEDFRLLCKNVDLEGKPIDYCLLKTQPTSINHFFDIDKPRNEINIHDLIEVARAHGGRLVTNTFKEGDIYKKVEWETVDGEKFIASPHTVLYCGHWWNISYKEYAWDFDRLAKTDKIYAQIWYDHHDKDEDNFYYYDDNFQACYRKLQIRRV